MLLRAVNSSRGIGIGVGSYPHDFLGDKFSSIATHTHTLSSNFSSAPSSIGANAASSVRSFVRSFIQLS